VLLTFASAQAAVDVSPATHPGWSSSLPPGTYRLQAIQSVDDATLLDERGRAVRLSALTRGKITLLDVFLHLLRRSPGLPFCASNIDMLRDRILRDPGAGARRAIRGISCDPSTDTPESWRGMPWSSRPTHDSKWQVFTRGRVSAAAGARNFARI